MQPEPWMRPHLAALEASVLASFRFRYLPALDDLECVQGFRVESGAMDVFVAESADRASAARFWVEDFENGCTPPALWYRRGEVVDVVMELLELEPHGSPGAPVLARERVNDLWVPYG